jgi:hypothetical protein
VVPECVCPNITLISTFELDDKLSWNCDWYVNRLCGPVARVPGYRSRGPGSDSRHYQIFWEVVGLEQGPLSLVSTIEKLTN